MLHYIYVYFQKGVKVKGYWITFRASEVLSLSSVNLNISTMLAPPSEGSIHLGINTYSSKSKLKG